MRTEAKVVSTKEKTKVTKRDGSKGKIEEYSPMEKRVMAVLGDSQMCIEQLALSFADDLKGFLETLSIMELEGKVKRFAGGMYRRG